MNMSHQQEEMDMEIDPGQHMQQQHQMQRSLQASKQMLYGVFEHIVGDLEELERREQTSRKQSEVQQSEVKISDQSHKKKSDVESIVDTQLLIFQSMLKGCPIEVKEDVQGNLIDKTLNWSAARADRNLPQTKTDAYSAQLFEVLHTGCTHHPEVFSQPPHIESESEMRAAVSGIMVGQHKMRELDEGFKADPAKKATLSKIRGGVARDAGIDRIFASRPDLEGSLKVYRGSSLR